MISTGNKNNGLINDNGIENDIDNSNSKSIETSEENNSSTLNQLTENFAKINNEINELDVILNNNLYKLQLLMLGEKGKGIDYSTHIENEDLSIREQSIIVHHLIENRDILNTQVKLIMDKIRQLMSEISGINENQIQESSLNQRINDLKEKL